MNEEKIPLTVEHHSISTELDTAKWPLPLDVIPNYMGINLCAVEGMTWSRWPDGQLVQLTIHFAPDPKGYGVNVSPYDPS